MTNKSNILKLLALMVTITIIKAESFYETKPVFLKELNAQILLEQINEIYLHSATDYRKFYDDPITPEMLMREKLRPYYAVMKRYNWQNFTNPLLKRQFEVLLRGDKFPPVDYAFKNATHVLHTMSKERFLCDKSNFRKCNMAFLNHVKSVFIKSDNLEEIKWYWKEWRNQMPQDIKDAFHYYIQYYQNMSTPEMPASAVWYDQYEDPNFIDELESIMDTIRPFYRELHTHLRHVLRVRYGDNVVSSSGLIPHHLMEQAMYQAWKKNSVLLNPFPQRKLPNLQNEIDDKGFFPYDLVNMSSIYFRRLGFGNLTDDFIRDHFIEMEPGEGGADCKSRIYTFGEIELNYCSKVSYKKILQTYGDVSQIQYALMKNNMSVGLNQEACPGFGSAIGEAIILAASTPHHLQVCLGLLTGYNYDDMLNLNRLYRLAVHTVLSIPTYFVHEKLWIDIIDKKITPQEYNCHYWNLMEKYMGVERPLETNSNAYDMPYKFYEGILEHSRSTKKLFGEFLGYEIYRAVCLKIGEYQRGNAHKLLHNCDFDNNPHGGDILKEMMNAGSTKSWREIIKSSTTLQIPKLSGTAFLEYFEPLNKWISEDNSDKKLHVGWRTADKCRPQNTGDALTNKTINLDEIF